MGMLTAPDITWATFPFLFLLFAALGALLPAALAQTFRAIYVFSLSCSYAGP